MLLTINYEPPPPPTGGQSHCEFVYCALVLGEGNCTTLSKGGEGRVGQGRVGYGRDFSTEVKENDIYLIFVNLKKSDKPTDGQTLWLNFQKNSEHFGNS